MNARNARHFLLLGAVMVALELALPRPLRTEILSTVAVVGIAVAVPVRVAADYVAGLTERELLSVYGRLQALSR